MPTLRYMLLSATIVALVISACAGASETTPPVPSPSRGPITTEEQAVARVIELEPRLTGIAKVDPSLIGQASWFDVAPASGVGAFLVTIRIGWGDCPAGCINERRSVYAVLPDGGVTLQSEGGSVVPPEAWPSPGASG